MDKLAAFQYCLNDLLLDYNLDRKSLCRNLNMNRSVLDQWMSDRNYPSIKNCVILSDFFHCSVDYLFGLTDSKAPPERREIAFYPRFRELADEYNFTNNRVAGMIGMKNSGIYKWKNQGQLPQMEYVLRLAEVFACSIEYLLGRTDKR